MRILRGFAVGVLCLVLWVFFSFLISGWFIAEYGIFTDVEFDIFLAPPWMSIPMIISFFGMFVGPLYYWIIEPIWNRLKDEP